jgi:hypothetical protein
MTGMTLFDYADKYPHQPGFKARGTSEAAAEHMKTEAPTLREACLIAIQHARYPLTADEVAGVLNKSVLSIRPRVAELAAKGLIVDSGTRRENASGRDAIAWRVP